jgi:hypothetical protein
VSTLTKISSVVPLPEYEHDLKRLRKRFRTLDDDMRIFVRQPLTVFLRGEPVAGRFDRALSSELGFEYPVIYVAKGIACRALKGSGSRTGLRLVCAWFEREDRLELVELFFKGDKDIEDKKRLRKLYT